MSFSKRALSALSVAMMRLREQDTLGATPSRRFFSACSMRESSSRRHQGPELRHFQSGRLPWSRPMGANKIGNNGSIQQIGFVAIASAASVLFDSPRIKQTHPMACAMEPQRNGMAVGSGGFQACPNLWNVVLFEDAGQLSKALGIILKAKAHCFAAGSSHLGLHAFLGDVQAQHRE